MPHAARQPRSWLIFDVRQNMKGAVLLPFFVSGALGAFIYFERLSTIYLLDPPSRGFVHDLIRWTILGSVWWYPGIWLVAFTVAVVGLLRDWSARLLIAVTFLPYLAAGAPFVLFPLLKYV